jgi:hypothetical protein
MWQVRRRQLFADYLTAERCWLPAEVCPDTQQLVNAVRAGMALQNGLTSMGGHLSSHVCVM